MHINPQLRPKLFENHHAIVGSPEVMCWRSCVSANASEHSKLQRVLTVNKGMLQTVNQAVRDCENLQRLEALQKKIDKRQQENASDSTVRVSGCLPILRIHSIRR